MFDRERFVADLRSLAGRSVRWLHQGCDPETGMDCIGAPKWAYERQGLKLPDELDYEFTAYHRPPNGEHMLEVARRWLEEITFAEMRPADMAVIYVRRNPCHWMIKLSQSEYGEAFGNLTGIGQFRVVAFDSRLRVAACFRIPDFET